MLLYSTVVATLPATDLNRAKQFYTDKLGLHVTEENGEMLTLHTEKGSDIVLYKREPTKADHTVVAFGVDDVEAEVKELKNRGIKFEEYDMPGIKTVNSIADWSKEKMAWFKDSEGNILGLSEHNITIPD